MVARRQAHARIVEPVQEQPAKYITTIKFTVKQWSCERHCVHGRFLQGPPYAVYPQLARRKSGRITPYILNVKRAINLYIFWWGYFATHRLLLCDLNAPLPNWTWLKTWPHPQNRKYITYSTPSEDDRATDKGNTRIENLAKFGQVVPERLRCSCGQTNK